MTDAIANIPIHREGSLLGVIDRLLEHGVMVQGDLEISVAGVDLLSVGLKVFLASIDKADDWKRGIGVADDVLLNLLAPAPPPSEVKLSGRDFLARRRAGHVADAGMTAQLKILAELHGGRIEPREGRDLSSELRIAVNVPRDRRAEFLADLARDLPSLTLAPPDTSAELMS